MISSIRSFARRHSQMNWSLLDQAMVSGVNFLSGVIIARYLGIEEFGVFSIALLIVQLANDLQNPLIVSPMMSIGPKRNTNELPEYFGSLMIQQFAWAVFTSALVFVCALTAKNMFPEWGMHTLTLPLTAAVFSYQSHDFMRRYFFAIQKPAIAFSIDAVRYLGQLSILIAVISTNGASSSTVLWIVTFSSVISVAIGFLKKEPVKIPTREYFKSIVAHHWDFSRWLAAGTLLQWISTNFFTIASSAILGAGAAGAIRACQTIMGVSNIILLGLENVAPRKAASLYHKHGIKAMMKYLDKVLLFGGGSMIILVFFISIAPEFWLNLFFGEEYAGHGDILMWVCTVFLMGVLGMKSFIGLRSIEKTKPIFWVNTVKTIFTLLFSAPLIIYFGLTGAMMGMLITKSFSSITYSIILHREARKG